MLTRFYKLLTSIRRNNYVNFHVIRHPCLLIPAVGNKQDILGVIKVPTWLRPGRIFCVFNIVFINHLKSNGAEHCYASEYLKGDKYEL